MRKSISLLIVIMGAFITSSVFAGTYPNKMGTDDTTYGWKYVTYKSGDIDSNCSGVVCYYSTWELPMIHIDGVYGRVGKWGGSYDTDPYYSFSDWYVEKDGMAHTCDATLGIWSQNSDIMLCNGVDTHSVNGSLTTCTTPSDNTYSCRTYYAREESAYDDTNLTLSGEGIRTGIYMVKAYKYASGGTTYYRAFVVNNIS